MFPQEEWLAYGTDMSFTICVQLIQRHVGYADGADFSLLLQIHETTHGLRECQEEWLAYSRSIVDTETFKTVFYFNDDSVGSQADIHFFTVFYSVGRAPFVFPPDATFCGDDDLAASVFNGLTNHLFAVSPAVRRRGVDQCDTGIECSVYRPDGFPVIRSYLRIAAADCCSPESDNGRLDSGLSQWSVLHLMFSWFCGSRLTRKTPNDITMCQIILTTPSN